MYDSNFSSGIQIPQDSICVRFWGDDTAGDGERKLWDIIEAHQREIYERVADVGRIALCVISDGNDIDPKRTLAAFERENGEIPRDSQKARGKIWCWHLQARDDGQQAIGSAGDLFRLNDTSRLQGKNWR